MVSAIFFSYTTHKTLTVSKQPTNGFEHIKRGERRERTFCSSWLCGWSRWVWLPLSISLLRVPLFTLLAFFVILNASLTTSLESRITPGIYVHVSLSAPLSADTVQTHSTHLWILSIPLTSNFLTRTPYKCTTIVVSRFFYHSHCIKGINGQVLQ